MIGELVKIIASNPVIGGAVGVTTSGMVLYSIKSLPVLFYRWVIRRFTVTLCVTGEDPAFDWINDWLSTHPNVKKTRTL